MPGSGVKAKVSMSSEVLHGQVAWSRARTRCCTTLSVHDTPDQYLDMLSKADSKSDMFDCRILPEMLCKR
jgi:hypothetical protein